MLIQHAPQAPTPRRGNIADCASTQSGTTHSDGLTEALLDPRWISTNDIENYFQIPVMLAMQAFTLAHLRSVALYLFTELQCV